MVKCFVDSVVCHGGEEPVAAPFNIDIVGVACAAELT